MSSHGQWTPGDLVPTEGRWYAEQQVLLDLLARHATSVQLLRVDAAGGRIEADSVAEFLAQVEQVIRALRRHVELPAPPEAPMDEALAAGARAALREAVDAPRPTVAMDVHRDQVRRGYFSNSGAGSPLPPVENGHPNSPTP